MVQCRMSKTPSGCWERATFKHEQPGARFAFAAILDFLLWTDTACQNPPKAPEKETNIIL